MKILDEVETWHPTAQFAFHYLFHYMQDPRTGTFIRPAKFHQRMYECLDEPKQAYEAPRRFAKSTICSVFKPLDEATNPQRSLASPSILLISQTEALAHNWSRRHAKELEANVELLQDRNGRRSFKSAKWTDDLRVLSNGVEIHYKGWGTQVRGGGHGIVVCDDLENNEMVRSDVQREKFREWFMATLLPTLEPGGQIIWVGSAISPLGMLHKIIENDDGRYDEWVKRKFRALETDPNGNEYSTWPERWPTEELKKKRRDDERAFACEYQSEPYISKECPIQKEWIKYYELSGKYADLWKVTAIDPAISRRDKADYTGISTWGVSRKTNNIYCLESQKIRGGVYEQANALLRHYKEWMPSDILVEENAYQKALSEVIWQEAQKQRLYPPIRPVRADRDKRRRVESITHLFRQGKVFLPRRTAESLVDEFLQFPFGEHDDQVDASVHCLQHINKEFTRRPRVRIKKHYPEPVSDPVTGRRA